MMQSYKNIKSNNKGILTVITLLFFCLIIPTVYAGATIGTVDQKQFAVYDSSGTAVGSQVGTDNNPVTVNGGDKIFVVIQGDWTSQSKDIDMTVCWRVWEGTWATASAKGSSSSTAWEYWESDYATLDVASEHFGSSVSALYLEDGTTDADDPDTLEEFWYILEAPTEDARYELVIAQNDCSNIADTITTAVEIWNYVQEGVTVKEVIVPSSIYRNTEFVINATVINYDDEEHNNTNVTLNLTGAGDTSGWTVTPGLTQTLNFTNNETKYVLFNVTPSSGATAGSYIANVTENYNNTYKESSSIQLIPLATGTPNIQLNWWMMAEGYIGSDKVQEQGEFDDCPISLNDYGDTTAKCGLWDCAGWSVTAGLGIGSYCNDWNCTEWNNDVTCSKYECESWGTSVADKLQYCDGGYNCTTWAANGVCENWNCPTWIADGEAKYDAVCSGVWDCTSWSGSNTCENWNCTDWTSGLELIALFGGDPDKNDFYCSGAWNCTDWHATGGCDNWDCTQWTEGTTEKCETYCSGVINCTSWNEDDYCETWECSAHSEATIELDARCDQWSCITWDETREVCETWNCSSGWEEGTPGGDDEKDYYCSGGYECAGWEEFGEADTSPPEIDWTSPTATNGTEADNKNYIVWNVTLNETGFAEIEINGTNKTATCIGADTNRYCYYNETGLITNQTRCADGWANDTVGNWNKTLNTICRDIVIQAVPATVECSNCADCSNYIQNQTALSTVKLIANIDNDVDNCIEFNGADEITFDCQGYYIDGDNVGGGTGIDFTIDSNSNTIKDCNISEFAYGIYVSTSEYNNFTNITSNDNTVYGIDIFRSNHSTFTDFTMKHNDNAGFLIYAANNNTITNATLYDNVLCGDLDNIFNVTFTDINCSDNFQGFYLTQSSNNTFTNVNSSWNTQDGYAMHGNSDYNIINNSYIINNSRYGLYLYNTSVGIIPEYNQFYNNYINNTVNAYNSTELINHFNTTNKTGPNIIEGDYISGNYWTELDGSGSSDECSDTDQDGYCDTSYEVWHDNFDELPLTSVELDETAPKWNNNQTNDTQAGTWIEHSVYWEDNVQLSGYIFSFCNGTWNGSSCKTVDAGSGAVDGATSLGGLPVTIIDLNNPATINATITRVEIWSIEDMTNVKVGTFEGSGDTYTNRDSEIIGSVTGGSKQTFTGLSVDIVEGDFLAIYMDDSSDYIEGTATGGAGIRYLSGDQMDTGEQSGYISMPDYLISIYGDNDFNNDTWTEMTGTNNWSNVTKYINETVGANVAWKIWTNDTSNNDNTTDTFNYTTTGPDTSFTINITDYAGGSESADGGATFSATSWFNDTEGSGNSKRVNGTVEGSNPQTELISFINYTNIGDTTEKIYMWVNQTLPTGIELFYSKDGDPDTNYFSLNNTEWALVNNSVGTGESEYIWIWANFTNRKTGYNELELWINSTSV